MGDIGKLEYLMLKLGHAPIGMMTPAGDVIEGLLKCRWCGYIRRVPASEDDMPPCMVRMD